MLSTGYHATYANPGPYYLQTTLYGQAFLNTRSRDKLLCFQVSKADQPRLPPKPGKRPLERGCKADVILNITAE